MTANPRRSALRHIRHGRPKPVLSAEPRQLLDRRHRAPSEDQPTSRPQAAGSASGVSSPPRPVRPNMLAPSEANAAPCKSHCFSPISPNANDFVLCACLDVAAHIIGPAGFDTSDRRFRRAGMDYLDHVRLMRHDLWSKIEQWRNEAGYRLVLFTTKSRHLLPGFSLRQRPTSCCSGAKPQACPTRSSAAADARLGDPDQAGELRSLNVASGGRHGSSVKRCRQTGFGQSSLRRFGELRGQGNLSDPAGGQGAHAGPRRRRFAGSPAATSGAAASRIAATAACQFCDTDFVGTDGTLGGRYATAHELADTVAGAMDAASDANRYVVLTGGEPHAAGRCAPGRRACTRAALPSASRPTAPSRPPGRPRLGLRQPQGRRRSRRARRPRAEAGAIRRPSADAGRVLPASPSSAFSLQPMDGPDVIENTARAVEYCLRHPQWRLSLQHAQDARHQIGSWPFSDVGTDEIVPL